MSQRSDGTAVCENYPPRKELLGLPPLSLVLQPILLASLLPRPTTDSCKAYMDDSNNHIRSQFIYFHNNTHPLAFNLSSFLHSNNIPFRPSHAIVLGTPLGSNDVLSASALNEYLALNSLSLEPTVGEHTENSSTLSCHHTFQFGMPCFFPACGVSKFNYLLRVVRPSVMRDTLPSLTQRSNLPPGRSYKSVGRYSFHWLPCGDN